MAQSIHTPSPSPQARGANTPNAQERPDMAGASNRYTGSDQSHQFAGGDNRHAGRRAGALDGDGEDTTRPGPEEIPFEDDRPQRFPAGDTKA